MNTIRIFQRRHYRNFDSLDAAIGEPIRPRRQVGSNFPLAIAGRNRRHTRVLFPYHILQGPLVLVVDRAIGVIVKRPFVRRRR